MAAASVLFAVLVAVCAVQHEGPSTGVADAADLFTSAAGVHKLFHLEKELAGRVNDHIDAFQRHIEQLQHIAAVLNNSTVPSSHLSLKPWQGFEVIKRLSELQDAIKPPSDTPLVRYMEERQEHIPDKTDVQGASQSLLRLCRTYAKHPKDLLPDSTAQAYFDVGREAYNQNDFFLASQWLEAGLEAYNNGASAVTELGVPAVSKLSLLDFLAYSKYKLGELEHALQYSEEILKIDPEHRRVMTNVEYYRGLLNDPEREISKVVQRPNYDHDNILQHSEADMENYRQLCQGKTIAATRPIELADNCTVTHFGVPSLFWKPQRVEFLSAGRRKIRIFRNFATDRECDKLVNMTQGHLKRALAFAGGDKGMTTVDFRVSTVAWFKPHHNDVVERMHRRIPAVTGLDIRQSEDFQISNYGIGGHYEPHMDWGRGQLDGDDRLATFLLYLSNVEAGGGTVFPRLGVGVQPSKGDALFWINLHETGEGDTDTLHGACPILSGAKWVANKWIHETGN